jgi:hypothetical protein
MERSRAHDAVECAIEGEVLQIGRDQGHAAGAELWVQMLAGEPQDVLRNVERDDPSSRQRFQQLGG